MPKREDEYWAGMKKPQGRGLCPFCGSSNIYYNKRYDSWRCIKCEKSFPMPSYGPGGDFGKEARWFGKTTEEARRREFAEAAREARARKPRKSRGVPGWLIPGLVVFLLMMFGVVVWTLWGSDITDFFSITSTSPPTEVSELPPEETATPPDTSSGGVIIPSSGDGVSVFDSKQPAYSKTFGTPINLINNESATDPTWQQLVMFLFADTTDQKDYSLFSFPCGAFAEEVHNNAEAAGIGAAWVSVDFEDDSEGHALNAFNTIDKGLVFIDCTGQQFSLVPIVPFSPGGSTTYGDVESWDKIAYIQVGKTYGLVSLDADYGSEYSDYEQWQQDKLLFDSKLDAYKEQVGGRLFVPQDEYRDLMRQLDELDALASRLGGFWEPFGVVSKIEIYW